MCSEGEGILDFNLSILSLSPINPHTTTTTTHMELQSAQQIQITEGQDTTLPPPSQHESMQPHPPPSPSPSPSGVTMTTNDPATNPKPYPTSNLMKKRKKKYRRSMPYSKRKHEVKQRPPSPKNGNYQHESGAYLPITPLTKAQCVFSANPPDNLTELVCTYDKGYITQRLYSCLSCTSEGNPAGVCEACRWHCHSNHVVIELWEKRDFRCDCGGEKMRYPDECAFNYNYIQDENEDEDDESMIGSEEEKIGECDLPIFSDVSDVNSVADGEGEDELEKEIDGKKEKEIERDSSSSNRNPRRPPNSMNRYNHNFDGLYCRCNGVETPHHTMFQCDFCEDWYHDCCLGPLPRGVEFDVVCGTCALKYPFLEHPVYGAFNFLTSMGKRVPMANAQFIETLPAGFSAQGCKLERTPSTHSTRSTYTYPSGFPIPITPHSDTHAMRDEEGEGEGDVEFGALFFMKDADTHTHTTHTYPYMYASAEYDWRDRLCRCVRCVEMYGKLGIGSVVMAQGR